MMQARRADPIRLIATRLRQEELREITRRPGVNEAFRVTIQYHDGRHPNQVATLTRGHGGACSLLVANVPYLGVDLWLVERASGSFYHDIVLSPEDARGFFRELILAIREHLPEALRGQTGWRLLLPLRG